MEARSMERVVSLLPSLTEIVCALGLQERLVGRSHECDHPPGIERLPVLTRAKLDPEKSSREIDGDVVRLVREGLSVYRVEAERLRALLRRWSLPAGRASSTTP